jgi:hypothetical protein
MRYFMLVALLSAAGCGGTDTLSTLPAGTIIIPTQVGSTGTFTSIRDGTFIAWHSGDGVHHSMASTSAPPLFTETDVPAGGTSVEAKLITPGDTDYYCTIHGAAVESGTVHVAVPGS